MHLFHTLDELKPFVFRITDNGGETSDRYTIATCDGSYVTMSADPYSPRGVCISAEGLDPLRLDERVEAGLDRDIRWVDLPKDCQRAFYEGVNEGYSDWLRSLTVPSDQADVQDISQLSGADRIGKGIFGTDGSYSVLCEEVQGPFASLREAILYTLPDGDDLSGPEHHPSIDIWEEGNPAEPWDRSAEPAVLPEGSPHASCVLIAQDDKAIAYFADEWDAENYLENKVDHDLHPGPYSIRGI